MNSSQNQHIDTMNSNNIYHYTGGLPEEIEGEGITHVIVEDGVESIDDEAFAHWKQLVSVHIPSSVKRIGKGAFFECKSLLSINLLDSLQKIGPSAFHSCESLSTINLPGSLNEIGGYAFRFCKSLSKILIPPLIISIQRYTFGECTSLSEVIIPPSVIEIDYHAFNLCHSLKSVKLANGLQKIKADGFHSCSSLESIQIPTTTTSIGWGAFRWCTSLSILFTSATLQQGSAVFWRCDSNLIILTDVDGYKDEKLPSITLNNIHQCIRDLPNNPIPPNQQLQTLHQVLQQRFPNIAHRAQQSSLTLLHLIVYFPTDIYELLSTLLTKCPEAITAVDSNGKTPIHHVITSTRHNMHPNCYNLLMRHCPDTVVHQAIRAGGLCWDDLHELVEEKSNALTLEDEESGLLPFMLAATPSSYTDDDVDLSVVHGLLCMDPSVLKDYGI